jgi:hypothetical protein
VPPVGRSRSPHIYANVKRLNGCVLNARLQALMGLDKLRRPQYSRTVDPIQGFVRPPRGDNPRPGPFATVMPLTERLGRVI